MSPRSQAATDASIAPDRFRGLILTPRIIAGHQIAALLQRHGWHAVSLHERMCIKEIRATKPGILVVDIAEPDSHGLRLLQDCRKQHACGYVVAICLGGNTPGLRMARQLGVDGIFYLDRGGLALDRSIGLAASLRASSNGAVPVAPSGKAAPLSMASAQNVPNRPRVQPTARIASSRFSPVGVSQTA